ncbi:MAG: GldG family protein [Methylococcales bacterium]|nr:GldG family protein [Methylococcales bacterium]
MSKIKIFLRKRSISLLLIGLLLSTLAFLTQHYSAQIDISANASNTLSPRSQQLLNTLDSPVNITAYIPVSAPIRPQISQLILRYQQHKKDISFVFIDPQHDLKAAKSLNIGKQGLIVVHYKGRIEKITFLDESSLSNALLQLSVSSERWVSFLTGHGERHASGKANFDLGLLSQELARRNIKTQSLDLVQIEKIPDNTALLVLSTPSIPLLSGEINLIKNYLDKGGNLLLLTDPDDRFLTEILQKLGVSQHKGSIIDNSSGLYGIDDHSFVLVSDYNRHPITKGMKTITVYPQAAALTITQKTEFFAEPFLKTLDQAQINKTKGSLTVGIALTRNLKQGTQQRIAVLGDGDFLSNTFLGNVGNLELGLRLFNWLIHDDQFIEIPLKTAKDKQLILSTFSIAIMGFGFLFILPLSLIAIGFFIGYRRKNL